MTERTPSNERYDAVVDFDKSIDTAPTSAYGLVKFTYDLGSEGLVPAAAEPLFHDLRDPDITPRLSAGSDFWPLKAATDVVVTGSAWQRGGALAPRSTVTLQVGERSKSIAVFGRRVVSMGRLGKPIFSDPEPFGEMPVVNANAYGGWDARVPMAHSAVFRDVLARQYDHPGIYPRNYFGKGYVVVPELPENEVELPNLEDPGDLLDPERFFVRDPQLWYRQPLPWCLDWSAPVMFHRYVWLATDAWFPAPEDDALPEVVRGFLPRAYRATATELNEPLGVPLPFLQEASLGMILYDAREGLPLSLTGMHPELEAQSFVLPAPPRLALSLGGDWVPLPPRLHSILVLPGRQKVQLVYAATYEALPRRYVPGVHAKIPLAIRVDDDAPIVYTPPMTIGEVFRASRAGAS